MGSVIDCEELARGRLNRAFVLFVSCSRDFHILHTYYLFQWETWEEISKIVFVMMINKL